MATRVEDNEPQNNYDERQRPAHYIQEHVITNNVYKNWSKQHQTEWREPVHQQQRSACDLDRSDYPNVVRQKQCAEKLSRQACGHRAHVEEVEKSIQPKHEEDQAK